MLTQRKSYGYDFNFIIDYFSQKKSHKKGYNYKITYMDNLWEKCGVYGQMWAEIYNHGKWWPTPRQVVDGLKAYFMMQLKP